jgi:hypothetical protein
VSDLVIQVCKRLDLMLDFKKTPLYQRRTLDVCCSRGYSEPFTKFVGISYRFSVVLAKNNELNL